MSAKIQNCPLHGEHCKPQPIHVLMTSHAGIPKAELKVIHVAQR